MWQESEQTTVAGISRENLSSTARLLGGYISCGVKPKTNTKTINCMRSLDRDVLKMSTVVTSHLSSSLLLFLIVCLLPAFTVQQTMESEIGDEHLADFLLSCGGGILPEYITEWRENNSPLDIMVEWGYGNVSHVANSNCLSE